MKGSVISCTKAGFLFFVLLQTSFILYASAQLNSTNYTETVANNMTLLTDLTANSTNATSTNATTTLGTNATSSAMVSCRIFSCNYSACYNTFSSTNTTTCSVLEPYCEMRRDGDALYSVRCTITCLTACMNTSQNNCSINCCNTSNCVNSTLNSLLNSSVIMTTTTTTAATTIATTKTSTIPSTTMATNGKKCNKMTCNGETCYQGNTNVGLCSPGQNFCMLKKTQSMTIVVWTASCIEDCSKETVCTSTSTNCILECCNATTTSSCLKMNGQVNIIGSGTMAPCCHVPLLVSSFFLWLLMMGKPSG